MTTKHDTPAAAHPTLLTADQAAETLHVNVRTLANWRVLGRGPRYIRSGARALYCADALTKWLEAHTFDHTAAERAVRSGQPFRPGSATA